MSTAGRIRLAVLQDLSGNALGSFAADAVEPGITLLTDGWQGYQPLRNRCDHRPPGHGR